mmetsp:Transcript_10931/g.30730  ORF Transcript_10931/g.30730 Transcript_10931/m.30730 type:complete len:202 (+) Transcript_10931:219-824(+)
MLSSSLPSGYTIDLTTIFPGFLGGGFPPLGSTFSFPSSPSPSPSPSWTHLHVSRTPCLAPTSLVLWTSTPSPSSFSHQDLVFTDWPSASFIGTFSSFSKYVRCHSPRLLIEFVWMLSPSWYNTSVDCPMASSMIRRVAKGYPIAWKYASAFSWWTCFHTPVKSGLDRRGILPSFPSLVARFSMLELANRRIARGNVLRKGS